MGKAEKPWAALKAQPKVTGTISGATSTSLMALRSSCFFLGCPPVQKELPPVPQPQGVPHWHIPSHLLSFIIPAGNFCAAQQRAEEGRGALLPCQDF